MSDTYTPGTWVWAKWKINQGFAVARPSWPSGLYLTEWVNDDGIPSFYLCLYRSIPMNIGFKVGKKELTATDWEVVE